MYQKPSIPQSREVITIPKGSKELWLQALQRPEIDMKCKAAQTIATAHRMGLKGFETTVPALREVFDQRDLHPTVRLAVAEALIALNAREAAASFFRHAQTGDNDLRELVEPVLARWDHRPAREVWLARLREPATSPRNLALAIRCLAEVGEEQAVEPLRTLVLSEGVSGPTRLQAARALARLRTTGLEKDAERLFGDRSRSGVTMRLAAVALLRRHRGAEAVALLQQMARDSEPAVAAPAVAHLLEIDPKLLDAWIDPFFEDRKANAFRDPHLRLLAVQVLFRRPSEKHVHLLVTSLDDEHSAVRVAARDSLRQLAGDGKWRPQILRETIVLLETPKWRQVEQATFLLVQLDHKPAADLLVKLLPFKREEVAIAAAWGLRKLDVAATLPEVAKYVGQRVNALVSSGEPASEAAGVLLSIRDHQLSQLNQLLGQQKYRAADSVLRHFVPKPGVPQISVESRAAAMWALGLIYEGGPPDDLVLAVEDCLNHDVARYSGDRPEPLSVRSMAAIALGRWKAKKTVPSLRTHREDKKPDMYACGWALKQITGEAEPPVETVRKPRLEWFLIPRVGDTK